ncbi:MAG: hypothetical protein AB1640_15330 [bacterium]
MRANGYVVKPGEYVSEQMDRAGDILRKAFSKEMIAPAALVLSTILLWGYLSVALYYGLGDYRVVAGAPFHVTQITSMATVLGGPILGI